MIVLVCILLVAILLVVLFACGRCSTIASICRKPIRCKPSCPAQIITVPGFGHTIVVDKIYGNDATGAIDRCPFKTIGAALKAAGLVNQDVVPCFDVWIMAGLYFESELVVPPGVSILGLGAVVTQSVLQSQIQVVNFKSRDPTLRARLSAPSGEDQIDDEVAVNPAETIRSISGNIDNTQGPVANGVIIRHTMRSPQDGTLLFMSRGSSVRNVVLWIDCDANGASLTGVDMSNDAAGSSSLTDCMCIVDGSLLPLNPGPVLSCVKVSSAIGLSSLAPSVSNCTLACFSNDMQAAIFARAVYHTAPGYFIVKSSFLFAIGANQMPNTVAADVTDPNGILDLQGCSLAATGPGISQTNGGTIYLNSSTLFQFTAQASTNGLGMATKLYSEEQVWGMSNGGVGGNFALAQGSTIYLPVGTRQTSLSNYLIPVVYQVTREHAVAYKLGIVARPTTKVPGVIVATLCTVDSSGNVTQTGLTTTLAVAPMIEYQTAISGNVATDLNAGNYVAVQIQNQGFGNLFLSDLVVTVAYN